MHTRDESRLLGAPYNTHIQETATKIADWLGIRELLQSPGPRIDPLTCRLRLKGAAEVGRAIRSEWWGGPLTA
jgi:hypothetical protein